MGHSLGAGGGLKGPGKMVFNINVAAGAVPAAPFRLSGVQNDAEGMTGTAVNQCTLLGTGGVSLGGVGGMQGGLAGLSLMEDPLQAKRVQGQWGQ